MTLRRFLHDCRGAVAVETALVSGLLVLIIAQVLDFGWLLYCKTQVKMAAQAAAAEAAIACPASTQWPVTTKCTGLTANMLSAARQVGLGSGITIASTTEGYWCNNATGTGLVAQGSLASPPTTCPNSATEKPGDYVTVTTNYTFSPMFPGLSVAASYAGTMSAVAWMRVG